MAWPVMAGTILIVEDDKKDGISGSRSIFRGKAFKRSLLTTAGRPLKLAQRHKPIFVILDLMLPVVDGWEV